MYEYKGKDIKWAQKLINLTKREVSLYSDGSGEICTAGPYDILNCATLEDDASPATFYVVEKKIAYEFQRYGRGLDDIALVLRRDVGRDGVMVDHLIWAKNPNIRIRLT